MNKFINVVVAAILLAGLAVPAASASTIENTGPDSVNVIKETNENECKVDNDNDVEVDNDNDQNAGSGDAETDGNNNGGNAGSGDAGNENTTGTDVTIDNGGCDDDKEETDKPGQGAGPVKPNDKDNGDKPTMTPEQINGRGSYNALPDTDGSSPVALAAIAAAAAGVVAVGARLGASAYARIKS